AGVEQLLPVLERTPVKDLFADPFEPTVAIPRPALVIVDDGVAGPAVEAARARLLETAERYDVNVETLRYTEGSELARYAAALGFGSYVAAYLGIGLDS